jgi:primary-amine oxidase
MAAELHPLHPLTPDEIRRAAAIARTAPDAADAVFISIALREPPKEAYLHWADEDGPRPARQARAAVYDAQRRVREIDVDLATGEVVADRLFPNAQPPITPDEYVAAEAAAKADPLMLEALAKRGVVDMDLVQIDVLAANAMGHELEEGHRIARAVPYLRGPLGQNGYARPIESLLGIIDLDQMRVLAVEEYDVKPVPEADGEYAAGTVPARDDLRPIEITQPEGVSFELEGNRIRWHEWAFSVALDAQEGLVLHDVRYAGRRVMHRASCAEMIVPYGDPHPMHNWRVYFDAGEYGLGACTNSLVLGCDCVGDITYLDAHLANGQGEVVEIANAICLHEEDFSLLWKHTDHGSGAVESRRARRFVVNSMATVGNYDYAFRWNFGLDGHIELELQLHGIISTMAHAPGEELKGTSMVDAGLSGPHHQHLFCFRLDLDVDGTRNTVREVEAEAVPIGPDNPVGNAFRARTTVFRTEDEAKRSAADGLGRAWYVGNPHRLNAVGGPVSYRIVPMHGVTPMLAQPESAVSRRAGFGRNILWVTPHREEERHAAGTYPYGRLDQDGLPEWTAADRPIEDEDVVCWYTVGVTHFVRTEDWPVMPVARAGFRLEPAGFFDRNPTLDVPPSEARCRHRGA